MSDTCKNQLKIGGRTRPPQKASQKKTPLFDLSTDNLIFYPTGLHLRLLQEHFSIKTLLTTCKMENNAVQKSQNQSLMWNINSSFLLLRLSSMNYDSVYNHSFRQLPILHPFITLILSQGTHQTLLPGIFMRFNILHNLGACINIYCSHRLLHKRILGTNVTGFLDHNLKDFLSLSTD